MASTLLDQSKFVELQFGPMLIGVCLNCMLYGVTVVQTHIYFQRYKKDARWMKVFVLYLLFCETVNTVCDIGVVYEPLIDRHGTPRVFTLSPIMLATDAACTVMISTPVQIFIAWRVMVMSKSTVLPVIIAFFAVASFVGGIATSVFTAVVREYTRFFEFKGAPISWLAASTIADIIITASLVYNLMRLRTGFAATNDLINRLIRLTVQTGLITSTCALIDLMLPTFLQKTTVNFAFDFVLSKLYSNSLLSTLNARGGWKETAFQDNVLFGHGSIGDSGTRGLTQMEFLDPRTRQPSEALISMKTFHPGSGYHHNGSVLVKNATSRISEDV